MATPALTISDFNGKFQAIQSYITPDTLGLINGSETMKGLIRAYEADPND